MITQSRHANFNIGYEPVMKKFFITSKSEADDRPSIGGFDLAAQAIEFALKRVS